MRFCSHVQLHSWVFKGCTFVVVIVQGYLPLNCYLPLIAMHLKKCEDIPEDYLPLNQQLSPFGGVTFEIIGYQDNELKTFAVDFVWFSANFVYIIVLSSSSCAVEIRLSELVSDVDVTHPAYACISCLKCFTLCYSVLRMMIEMTS